jgi:hypothetical protein
MFCRKFSASNSPLSTSHTILTWLVPALLWASLLATKGLAAGSAEVTAVMASHRDTSDPAVTAIGLQATGIVEETAATRVCLLIDTSASQAGPFLKQALAATEGFLAQTRPIDQVLLGAIDVTFVPAGDHFDAASSPVVEESLADLSARTPLGNTNLLGGLETVIETISADSSPAAIVYIGDGPGLTGILPADFAATQARLRQHRISFSAITVGPQVNWPCLASLAAGTGGNVISLTDDLPPEQAGATLASQVTAPILWPDDNTLMLTSSEKDAQLAMLPFQLPPLRHDRESYVLVIGPLSQLAMEVSVEQTPTQGRPDAWNEKTLAFTLPACKASSDNAFLEQLARNAFDTSGIFLPLLGREGLELAKHEIQRESTTLANLALQAKATGDFQAAARLTAAALARDPDNAQADIIQAAIPGELSTPIKPVAQTVDPPTNKPQPNASASPRSLPLDNDDIARNQSVEELRDIENRQRIRGQMLEREIAVGLRDARHLMSADPDMARIELKNLQQQVRASGDLDEALRSRLTRQIEISLREALVRSSEKLERDLATERAQAITRERTRVTGELQRREAKLAQLADRFQAIVNDLATGRPYRVPSSATDDERPLRELAAELRSIAPPSHQQGTLPITARISAAQASELAEILAYSDHNVIHRRHMQRGFMDALDNADDAAIPMSDEPPIRFPDASRWREVSKLREKWKSTNLAGDSPREEQIYSALKDTVSLDFGDGVSLREFELTLTDTLGVPVALDERVLAGELGLDMNEPEAIRGTFSGISARSALRRALSNVFETPLTYVVKDEVLLITDKQYAADNYISTKVYPVGDLVIPANPQLGTSGGATNGGGAGFGAGGQQQMNAMGGGGMGGMGGGMF